MTDTRALLLTDVVDSTSLSQTLGDEAMALLWAAHDRIARDLLPPWRGREIDKTDGLLLLFSSAADAAGYALAYHRKLDTLEPPLKARAGLHVGPVTLRENSAADVALGAKPVEVEGLAKPTAARVMSVALGGQTLLTAEARAGLGASRLRLLSHGQWRIKGVAEPLELFEAGDAHSPFTPPPDGEKAYRVVRQGDLWLPLRRVKHNLPAERDAFVGRQDALLDLAQRLSGGARLVSLLGIGGTGKTRLATRFGWTWLGEFPGGVWFCDLSQARDVDGIVHAVAQALDVPLGKDDPVVQLGHAINGRGLCLVILDNFEQVSRHAEETLGRWLNRARDAQFLVTTREVLGLSGEETMALAPLPPHDGAALFVRRAESAKRDFETGAEDHAAIAPLVKLLDGLPLAIELAAARVRVMPPRMLLARMSERFKLLSSSGGRRDRQATLRATFDWSWDLLSLPEKAALAQLSVFEGGFTLASAEAMLDLSAIAGAPWAVDLVQSLVDKSFVRTVAGERFDLLASVQEYAAEHLRTEGRYEGSGPQAGLAAETRHATYFAGLDEKQAIAGACAELGNLAVACRRAAARGDPQVAASALELAWAALKLRGPFRVGVELTEVVRSSPGLAGATKAKVDRVAGNALRATGRIGEAQARFEAALAAARAAGDRRCEGQVLRSLGDMHANQGRMDEAQANFTVALAVSRELDDLAFECEVLNDFGISCEHMGRMDDARHHFEAALLLARQVQDQRWEGGLLSNLGNVHSGEGRMDEAQAHYEAGLRVARDLGDRQWEGNALCNLGLTYQVQGRMSDAREQLDLALVVSRELGHARLECIVRCNLGIVCVGLQDFDQARAHYERALVIARELRDRRSEGQVLNYLGLLHSRQARFDEARRCLATGEALLHEVSDRMSLGILLCSRAEAEHLASEASTAQGALAQAESVAVEVGAFPASELGLSLARVRAFLNPAQRDTDEP